MITRHSFKGGRTGRLASSTPVSTGASAVGRQFSASHNTKDKATPTAKRSTVSRRARRTRRRARGDRHRR
jgi:hypothetical protein